MQDKTKGWLSILVIMFSFSFLYLLMFYTIPEGNKDIINIVIGMIIGTGFTSVVSFYFGSSEGSKKKTEMLDKMMFDTKDSIKPNIKHIDKTERMR